MIYNKETYREKILCSLPESDFNFISFLGTEYPCSIICNKCKTIYSYKVANSLLKKQKRGHVDVCPSCENSVNSNKKKERITKLLKSSIRPVDVLIEDIAWSSKNKITWKCINCDNTFTKAPASIIYQKNGFSCVWCESQYTYYTDDIIDYKMNQLWNNKEYTRVKSDLKDSNAKRRMIVKHNKCGHIWEVDLFHFLREGTACPECKRSKGEKLVSKYLDDHNIPYEKEKVIEIKNKKLRFDFFIILNNKTSVIEYNGIQHYEPIDFYGGEDSFLKQQINDQDKQEYCKDNNIDLIIIKYNDKSLLQSNALAQRLNGQVS